MAIIDSPRSIELAKRGRNRQLEEVTSSTGSTYMRVVGAKQPKDYSYARSLSATQPPTSTPPPTPSPDYGTGMGNNPTREDLMRLASPQTFQSALRASLQKSRQENIAPLEDRRANLQELSDTSTGGLMAANPGMYGSDIAQLRTLEREKFGSQINEINRRIDDRQRQINDTITEQAGGQSEVFQGLLKQQQLDIENLDRARSIEVSERKIAADRAQWESEMQLNLSTGKTLADLGIGGEAGKRKGLKEPDVPSVLNVGDKTVYDPVTKTFKSATSSGAGAVSPPTGQIVDLNLNGITLQGDTSALYALQKADAAMFAATGKHIQVGDDYRTSQQQADIYAKSGNGTKFRAAPPGQSLHEKGLAFDIVNWKEAQPYLVEAGLMNGVAANDSRMALEDPGHFSLNGSEFNVKGSLSDTDKAALGRMVFGSQFTENEKKIIDSAFAEHPNATREEIALLLAGYNPKENADIGEDLMSVILQNSDPVKGIMGFDFLSLNKLLNDSKLTNAIQKTENFAYQNAQKLFPNSYVEESNVAGVTKLGNDLMNKIKQLEASGENPIGNFSGTLEQWLGRFKSGNAQQVATDATNLIQNMAKTYLGSQMTSNELSLYEGIIPKLGDSTENFSIKVQGILNKPLQTLNATRQSVGLQPLDQNTLLNYSARTELYGEEQKGGFSSENLDVLINKYANPK